MIAMVDIPKKYNQDIQKMVDWHLSSYMPSVELNIMLNRILEHFCGETGYLRNAG